MEPRDSSWVARHRDNGYLKNCWLSEIGGMIRSWQTNGLGLRVWSRNLKTVADKRAIQVCEGVLSSGSWDPQGWLKPSILQDASVPTWRLELIWFSRFLINGIRHKLSCLAKTWWERKVKGFMGAWLPESFKFVCHILGWEKSLVQDHLKKRDGDL